MAQQITYDKAYDAVAPEDFPAMLEVPRYGRRSDAFDAIISATHDHKMLDVSDRIVWIRDGLVDKIENRADIEVHIGSIGTDE